jgi:hypothetical protein
MRLFVMAALTAIGLGLAASGAYAAPINATSIGKSTSEMSPLTTVHYRRYYHRHRATIVVTRPYYYGYGPYYHGYGLYYGYTRPSTNWPW